MKQAWLVQQFRAPIWEHQGIFDNEADALAVCRTDQYVVYGPFQVNVNLPDEPGEWDIKAQCPLGQIEE